MPIDHVVPPLEAESALRNALDFSSRRRNRRSLAVIGSAAAAVLCLGGFASVVYSADPGDGLYGLHTLLFTSAEELRDDVAERGAWWDHEVRGGALGLGRAIHVLDSAVGRQLLQPAAVTLEKNVTDEESVLQAWDLRLSGAK